MTSKQFKVGDKVKRVVCLDDRWKASSGDVIEVAGVVNDGLLLFDAEGCEGGWNPNYFELVESAEDSQTKEEVKEQEVILSFKEDSLKFSLKATNPGGYCCNEAELLLVMKKIIQIAEKWNTFSLTIEAEDKDNY